MLMKCSKCGAEWKVDSSRSSSITVCPFCQESLITEKSSDWHYFDNTMELLAFIASEYGNDALFGRKHFSDHSAPLMPQGQKNLVKQAFECGAVKILQDNMGNDQSHKETAVKQAVHKLIDTYASAKESAEQVIWELTNSIGWNMPQPQANINQQPTARMGAGKKATAKKQPSTPKKNTSNSATTKPTSKPVTKPPPKSTPKATKNLMQTSTTQSFPSDHLAYIPPGATVESITEIGFQRLNDTNWDEAFKLFNAALLIDSKYARAYMGLLCVELKKKNEYQLAKYEKPILGMKNYKKAMQFADDDYRDLIKMNQEKATINKKRSEDRAKEKERIEKERKVKEEEEEKLKAYNDLLDRFNTAKEIKSESSIFRGIASGLRKLKGYENSKDIIVECSNIAKELKEAEDEEARMSKQYKRFEALQSKPKSWQDLEEAAIGFCALGSYRNSSVLAEHCNQMIPKLKEEQYQQLVKELGTRTNEWRNDTTWSRVDDKRVESCFSKISVKFRELKHRDSEAWADDCKHIPHRLLDERHRIYMEHLAQQAAFWKSQGLCPVDGGKFKGFLTKKCERCGSIQS